MYLQKLEIQGFKSFAQKVSLSFNRGITSVVGPNGSGKSNVADSVRWVLGEQSMKLLRGKRAEDVIFAGSDKKKRLASAEVSVHFNNEDGRAPVDASEFAITRRVFRSGESEYLLNNRPTRLTDIALLLAKSNFGQRSYSIIGQGLIDEVLAATPQARKVFFDEAAGVRAFQIKKEQAENKLNQTRENLERVDLLVKEIEPRLRSLTRQVKRLEQRSEVEKNLHELQDSYYRFVWHDVDDQLTNLHAQRAEKEEARTTLDAKKLEVEEHLRVEESRKSRADEFESLQRKHQKHVDEKNALLREYSGLKGKRDVSLQASGKGNIVWLEKKRDELESRLTTIDDEITSVRLERDTAENHHDDLQQQLEDLAQKLQQIESRIQELRHQTTAQVNMSEVSAKLEDLFAQHEQVLQRLKKSESIEHVRLLHTELENFHNEFKGLLEKVRDTGAKHVVRDIEQLEVRLREGAQEKERLLQQVHAAQSEVRIFEDRLFRIEEEKNDAEQEIKDIERDIAENTSSGDERDFILEETERDVKQKLSETEKNIEQIRKEINVFNESEQKKKETLVALQKEYAGLNQQITEIVRDANTIAVEIARLETRSEDLEREMTQEMPADMLEAIKANQPEKINTNEIYGKILQVKKQLEFIGGIDPQVAEEYEETKSRYDFLSGQLGDLTKAIEDLDRAIEELEETIKKRFDEAFQTINKEFSIYFKKLFGGGRASLELIKEERFEDDDEEEDDEEADQAEGQERIERREKVITGIAIFATPPGKKLKSVGALSGGERALTSIALICAIISNNPSPFVVLDEVDAALDEANSERFASIVAELSKKTQFIIITHNRATMEHSSILYGVTMGDDGISKLLSVDVEHAESIITAHGNR